MNLVVKDQNLINKPYIQFIYVLTFTHFYGNNIVFDIQIVALLFDVESVI